MEYSMEDRARLIIQLCLNMAEADPVKIFISLAKQDFVRIHGHEHHILDGACILTAFKNAGGTLELEAALKKLMAEGLRMPGAACGLWGVCGAVTSIGAALAIIDGTGPLSTDGKWEEHMLYTSKALADIAAHGGPRCCKRDAFTAFKAAVEHINRVYGLDMPLSEIKCGFFPRNAQCIKTRCPYFPKGSI